MSPALLFSFLLSTTYAALFHLWRGGSVRRLGLLLLAAWIGFGLGQVAGLLLGWNVAMLGEVHLLEASFGSLVVLLIVSRPAV